MKKIGCVQHDCEKCRADRATLWMVREELLYVLTCINADKIPFDGDSFHEALRAVNVALEIV